MHKYIHRVTKMCKIFPSEIIYKTIYYLRFCLLHPIIMKLLVSNSKKPLTIYSYDCLSLSHMSSLHKSIIYFLEKTDKSKQQHFILLEMLLNSKWRTHWVQILLKVIEADGYLSFDFSIFWFNYLFY